MIPSKSSWFGEAEADFEGDGPAWTRTSLLIDRFCAPGWHGGRHRASTSAHVRGVKGLLEDEYPVSATGMEGPRNSCRNPPPRMLAVGPKQLSG
jgi:hypothetical protein